MTAGTFLGHERPPLLDDRPVVVSLRGRRERQAGGRDGNHNGGFHGILLTA
jgi:hypothetical protein